MCNTNCGTMIATGRNTALLLKTSAERDRISAFSLLSSLWELFKGKFYSITPLLELVVGFVPFTRESNVASKTDRLNKTDTS